MAYVGIEYPRERHVILREVLVVAVDWFSNAKIWFGACPEWLTVRLHQFLGCNKRESERWCLSGLGVPEVVVVSRKVH